MASALCGHGPATETWTVQMEPMRKAVVCNTYLLILIWYLSLLQRGCIACNAERCISHGNSVRPSVCLSHVGTLSRVPPFKWSWWVAWQTLQMPLVLLAVWDRDHTCDTQAYNNVRDDPLFYLKKDSWYLSGRSCQATNEEERDLKHRR